MKTTIQYDEVDPRQAKKRPKPNIHMTPKERQLNRMILEEVRRILRYSTDIEAFAPTEQSLSQLEIEVPYNDFNRLNTLIFKLSNLE